MAENNQNPPAGGQPPRQAEAAKVQPKKETVRISLPPKPAASSTVKLPTPSAAPAAPAAAQGAPSSAKTIPSSKSKAAPVKSAPAAGAMAGGAPAMPRRTPAAASAGSTLSGLDMGLGVVAALAGAAGLAGAILLIL